MASPNAELFPSRWPRYLLGLDSNDKAVRFGLSAATIILHCWGQSNMAGWTLGAGGAVRAGDYGDDRIRLFDIGKGPELLSNPDFATGTGGWSSTNGGLSIDADGAMVFTPSAASNPACSSTVSGLTIGDTYELTCEIYALSSQPVMRLAGLTEILGRRFGPGVGYADYFPMRARFVATATSHPFNINANSGSTPTGTPAFKVKSASCKRVNDTGASYPKPAYPIGNDADFADITALGVEPGYFAAKRLLELGVARRVILIPTAVGSTAMVGGPWAAGGSLQVPSKAKLAAAIADNPDAIPISLIIQGEQDAGVNRSGDAWLSAFAASVADFRTATGAANMPVIIGQMVPEKIAEAGNYKRIDMAHQLAPHIIPNVRYVSIPSGYRKTGEDAHYNADGSREMGKRMGDAISAL